MVFVRSLRRSWLVCFLFLGLVASALGVDQSRAQDQGEGSRLPGGESESSGDWKMASQKTRAGLELSLFVEAEAKPGRPAFRIETLIEATPGAAAATLMNEMARADETTRSGQTRRLLERTEKSALVHTYINLPFMFSDRELAVRIQHTNNSATGIHRIDWADSNEALPPAEGNVLRLASRGFWEFRPVNSTQTEAIYVSRAEVGGSLPTSLGDRMMKNQAIEAVERLGMLLDARQQTHVSGPPPSSGAISD